MACETCDHTMQRVNSGEPPVFWCPRCGTLKTKDGVPEFEAPNVIGRARSLCESMDAVQGEHWGNVYSDLLAMQLRSLQECVHTPGFLKRDALTDSWGPEATD